MFSHQGKWFSANFIWTIVVCLLLVSPVHLLPRPKPAVLGDKRSELGKDNKSANLETLNSKTNSVNAKNETDKPVFDGNESNNQNKESVTKTSISEDIDQARQLNIPFMAVPANWLATFQPSNAVYLASKDPLRIWALGSVSRFPTFLEKFVQRVQAYYSIYKYHDLSRPASLAIINPQYHLQDTTTGIDSMDQDSIEEDTIPTLPTLPNIEYLDENTTEMNYLDEEDFTDSNEYTGSRAISV